MEEYNYLSSKVSTGLCRFSGWICYRKRNCSPKRYFDGIYLQDSKLVYLSRKHSSYRSFTWLIKRWTKLFNFIKLRRGRLIVPFHGEIDFSADNIGMEICKELFDKVFPYLELTELGKREFCPQASDPLEEIISIPDIDVFSNE